MQNSNDLFTSEICKICYKLEAKYTCPKCNLRYCSLTCYRDKEHLQCSEKFYKDCCIEQMKLQKGSKEDKEKMMEILRRVQEESQNIGDPCSDDTVQSLEDRLQGLDLDKDGELVWEQLTVEEREGFQKMLSDGRISHLLDSYTPWWKCEHTCVVEVSSSADMSTPINPRPPIPVNLPPLNSLLKVQPSPLLKYNVVNVLYSYAYMIRLFNGSHMELLEQAVEVLYKLSAVLSANAVFHDCNSAINDVITRSQQLKYLTKFCESIWWLPNPSGPLSKKIPSNAIKLDKETATSLEFAYATMLDVSCIISSGSHDQCLVSHALSDVHHIMQVRCDQIKGLKRSGKEVISSKMLRDIERKLFFLLVWSREYYHDVLPLQKVIEMEHEGQMKELQDHRQIESKIEKNQIDKNRVHDPSSKTSQLIEEL